MERRIVAEARSVARRLRDEKERIIRIWADRARKELSAARGPSDPVLHDHLPAFLARLADEIEWGSGPRLVREANQMGKEHGGQRASLPGYQLDEVISEYRLLRHVLFEVLLGSTEWLAPKIQEAIHDMIDEGIRNAAAEFTRSLHMSEQRLALALDAGTMGVWDWDQKQEKLHCSEHLQKMWGYRDSEFSGSVQDFWSKVHPDDRKRVGQALDLALDGRGPYDVEYRVVWPDGSHHWIHAKGKAYFDPKGHPEKLSGTAVDITRRKKAEEALRNQQKWFEEVLDRLPTPVVLVDPASGELIFANRAAQETAFTIPRVVPEDFQDGYYAMDVAGKRIPKLEMPRYRLIQGGSLKGFEMTWHTPEGNTPLLINGTLLPEMHGHPSLAVLTFADISDIKRVQEQLAQTVLKLREVQILREQFVAALTHDLRGPMSTARAASELIQRFPDRKESVVKLAGYVLDSITRGDCMIQDLLDANRIQAGQPILVERAPCDLRAIADEVSAEMTLLFGDRFVVRGPEHVEGSWNSSALRRILENLLGNAVKYGDRDFPVTTTLEVQAEAVTLSVHNQGRPISPEDQKSLFHIFQRAETARSSGARGWGIGLTLVRGLAAALGGEVGVVSTPEAGTTFSVRLPLTPL